LPAITGLSLGVNTGYSREMVEVMLLELRCQGFTSQSMVCATEVPLGRPAPYISFQGALGLPMPASWQDLTKPVYQVFWVLCSGRFLMH